eukprot:Nitzschia sp. Nitz4//scaffold208_size52459//27149//28456//NITZ4_006813-RA/size52459-processed-gene-0.33-mRNA-1//-1//CDS//3329541660//139//frame0
MPQNLDEPTRKVIVGVTCLSLTILGAANGCAQFIVMPRLQKRIGVTHWTGPPLLRGCIGSLVFMLSLSAFLTAPIILLGSHEKSLQDASVEDHDAELLTSSINFCEDDFADSKWIAEPANTASNLASYWPLALWGLLGSPSQEWRNRAAGHKRFLVAYGTLLAIAIGSTFLHALLTAHAQGGDELPMLWFVASLSFMTLDVILQGSRLNLSVLISTLVFGYEPSKAQKQDRWLLHWLVGGSAVLATAIYCFSRENFLPFYIMFILYAMTATLGIIAICFFMPWNGNVAFRVQVLLPLAVCCGWMAIFAVSAWVSEMLFCASAQQLDFGPLAQWLANRAVHPFWHCSSAMLAWLLIQALLAGQGLQRGWGEPSLQCASWWIGGVPYVTFSKGPSHAHHAHVAAKLVPTADSSYSYRPGSPSSHSTAASSSDYTKLS